MSTLFTKEQCQKKLFNLGIKLGVSPKLISTRLLSAEDKEDMQNGLLPDDALELHVKLWKEHGMCYYSNGSNLPYVPSLDKPMQRYRGIGPK
jgi:hypothetical protein